MKSSLERELKLEPPVDFELPQLEGRQLGTRLFTSTYYDTPLRSLARAGITLRRRLENGVSRWQLKLPRAENARTEIEALGGPSIPPNELLALLKLHLRHAKLEPVATLRTRRAGVRVGTGGQAVADVTLDAVDVLDGSSVTDRFSELEVELIDGDESDLKRLGRELRQAGAQRSDGKAKVMRVLQLDTGGEPKKSASPAKRTDTSSASSFVHSSRTTRASGWTSTRRTCTSSAWRRGEPEPSSAPPRHCSVTAWSRWQRS